MKQQHTQIILLAAALVTGCLDYNLHDDMRTGFGDSANVAISLDSSGVVTGTSSAVTGTDGAGVAPGEASVGNETDTDGGEGTDGAMGVWDTKAMLVDTAPPRIEPDCHAPGVLVSGGPDGTDDSTDGTICVYEGPGAAAVVFNSDEPATVMVTPIEAVDSSGAASGVEHSVMVSPDGAVHHHWVGIGAPGETANLSLQVTDGAGNETNVMVSVTFGEGMTLVISEVLADPVGVEPDNEFVELFNYGSISVDLSGWMIDDNGDHNGDIIPEGTVIEPGAALVLADSGFSGPPFVDLGGSIGSSGLKNSASESVQLIMPDGTVVSEFNTSEKPSEGVSFVRSPVVSGGDLPFVYLANPGGPTPGQVDW